MKKNSFSHQLCVSLKMINDIMILPCIRELENSLHLGALSMCPSCPPKPRAAEPDPPRSPRGEGPPDLPGDMALGCSVGGAVSGGAQCVGVPCMCVTGLWPGLLPPLLGGCLPPHPQMQILLPTWVAAGVLCMVRIVSQCLQVPQQS